MSEHTSTSLTLAASSALEDPATWGSLVRSRIADYDALVVRFPGGQNAVLVTSSVLSAGWVMLLGELSAGLLPLGARGLLAALGGMLAARAPYLLPRWRDGRRFRRGIRLEPGAIPPASFVRVVGTVVPRATPIKPIGDARDAVYARTVYRIGGLDGGGRPELREDVRAAPFALVLADGRSVEVDPAHLALVGTGTRVRLPEELLRILHASRGKRLMRTRDFVLQQVVRPGDRLEIVARLSVTVSTSGQAISGRGTPVVLRAQPLDDELVWARMV